MIKLFNNKYIFFFILVSLFLHIVSVIFSIGFYSDDEHFQILEITAYLLDINKIAINDRTGHYWEWESGTRIRPWLQPYLFYLLLDNIKYLLSTNPFIWAFILRSLCSIIGFTSIIYLYFTFKDYFFKKNYKFNTLLYFTFWFYPFLHSRTSSENLSLSLFIISICLLFKVIVKEKNFNFIKFVLGSLLMGFSMVFKFTTVFNAFPFFLWFIIYRYNFNKILIFSSLIVITLSFGLYVDYINWGSFKNTYYQFYIHNLSPGEMGRMKYFGIDPWYFYFFEIIKQLAPLLSLFFLFGLIYFWLKKFNNIFTWITLFSFIIYTYIGHKEIRYMFSIYIFAPFFIAFLFEKISSKFILKFFKSLVIISNLIFLLITLITPANNKVSTYKFIYENIDDEQKIFFTNENPYLINNMEPFFYTHSLNKIMPINEKSVNEKSYWIVSNNYKNISINLENGCELRYSTYPKRLIEMSNNWKRFNLNWYIIYCE